MGKVILHTTMSLDGFIAGPHDELDWVFKLGSYGDWAQQLMDKIGAVVLGKRTYDVSLANGHVPYDGTIKVPQFVITHDAHKPVIQQGLTFTFITEGVKPAVKQAKEAAGNKNVVLLGASIDQQCLKAGLVDEIVIHLAPILLGEGIRLFDKLSPPPINLKKLAIEEDSKDLQITNLWFKVIK